MKTDHTSLHSTASGSPDRPTPAHALVPPAPLRIALATAEQREVIYRLRHNIYASELGQHHENAEHRLTDSLDAFNFYLVALSGEEMLGFVSITPPGESSYSIDKYLSREQLPFPFDSHLFEIRLLTVVKHSRGRQVAALLMYAAFRWAESHGGTRIMAIGRREILDMYLKAGLEPVGRAVQSGAVTFDVLQADVADLRRRIGAKQSLLEKWEREIDWRLPFSFRQPVACFHGGAFFDAIGPRFDALEKRHSIINADVLDAWFPPSPKVIRTLEEHLPWLLMSSPPTGSEGMIAAIAEARGLVPSCILPGAGSSDLIFRAFRFWLDERSRALILDPTYGEYSHVLEKVIRCQVDRLSLNRADDYSVSPDRLKAMLSRHYDLVVVVNPNSPTGRLLPGLELRQVIRSAPITTRFWIDETYIDYAGREHSLETLAIASENVVVCKSMSKVYALSGARAAYLAAGPHIIEPLRVITPPWVVSLPAQVAAVEALADPGYYRARYAETHALRHGLEKELRSLGLHVIPGCANFVLAHLPDSGPTAAAVVASCRQRGLFLRDATSLGSSLGPGALRLAVKNSATLQRMLTILQGVSP